MNDDTLGLSNTTQHRLKRMRHHLSTEPTGVAHAAAGMISALCGDSVSLFISRHSCLSRHSPYLTLPYLPPSLSAASAASAEEDPDKSYVLQVSDPLVSAVMSPHLFNVVNACNLAYKSNGTPLHAACSEGHHETGKLFVSVAAGIVC